MRYSPDLHKLKQKKLTGFDEKQVHHANTENTAKRETKAKPLIYAEHPDT